jgi:hypothetical protein
MWGFDVSKSAVGGQYQTGSLEGFQVPVQRVKSKETSLENSKTVTNPFFLYGLEYGLDPQMRALIIPMLKAQAERYRRTNVLTTSTTNAIESQPYILHSTAIGRGKLSATMVNLALKPDWSALPPPLPPTPYFLKIPTPSNSGGLPSISTTPTTATTRDSMTKQGKESQPIPVALIA